VEFEVSSRDIATYKRKWKERDKEVIFKHEMSPNENELFKNDATLIRLIQRCKEAEQKVIDHIDNKIEVSRSG
jgi:hypothetical protein